ncbi:MAG: hypothetical protein DDT41_01729 [candidate division WS2 bacterium]|nr:hypothetical protein [Candidatus Psychracetigena formicireducens]
MLDKIKEAFKKYPWLMVGIGGVALFLVYFLFLTISRAFGGRQRATATAPLPRPQQLPQVGLWTPRGATPLPSVPVPGEVPPKVAVPVTPPLPLPVQQPVIPPPPIIVTSPINTTPWQDIVEFAREIVAPAPRPITVAPPIISQSPPPSPFLTGVMTAPIPYDYLQQPIFIDHFPTPPRTRGGAHIPATVGELPAFTE